MRKLHLGASCNQSASAPHQQNRHYTIMPPKRKRKSKKSKTKKRSKRAYKPRPRRKLPALGGFPSKKLIRVRYTEHVSLAPNTCINFLANGPMQPYFDIVAGTTPQSTYRHQPMGLDQWEAIYRTGVCIGSKITAKAVNATDYKEGFTAASFQPFYFGVVTTPEPLTWAGSPFTDPIYASLPRMKQILEEGSIRGQKSRWKMHQSTQMAQNGRGPSTLSSTYSAHKLFGIPKKDGLTTQDSLRFVMNTAGDPLATNCFPERKAWFTLWNQDVPLTSCNTVFNTVYEVKIEYLILAYKRTELGLSDITI